jgi:hypothetical protein
MLELGNRGVNAGPPPPESLFWMAVPMSKRPDCSILLLAASITRKNCVRKLRKALLLSGNESSHPVLVDAITGPRSTFDEAIFPPLDGSGVGRII